MRLLGIDYGTKKIGIALSDEQGLYSFPYSIIQNRGHKDVIKKIEKICKENNVTKIILGKSVNFRGELNPVMSKIEKFKKMLEESLLLSVFYQTELLTTQGAKSITTEGKPRGVITRKNKQTKFNPTKLDASAASIILQGFIDGSKMIE